MRHPKTGALELQMDALLRSAADFEPELEAPFDLVERAMQRATRQIAVVRVQRPIVAILWGSAAAGAAASAAAAFLMTSPAAPSGDPLHARQAGIGAGAGLQVTAAEKEPPAPEAPSQPRRSFRVRTVPTRAQLAVDEAPAPRAVWQTEEVEKTYEHVVRPAMRIQVDEFGQPFEVETGILETLTVSETPVACGVPDTAGDETGDGTDETAGESRTKEVDLPSKEN